MTYKLEPWVVRISSPVIVVHPDGSECRYVDGRGAASDVFSKHLVVRSIRAISGEVRLELEEVKVPGIAWVGEVWRTKDGHK